MCLHLELHCVRKTRPFGETKDEREIVVMMKKEKYKVAKSSGSLPVDDDGI